MKTDKIIARLMEYCNTLDESDRKLINQFMERDETSKLPGIFTLASLLTELQRDLRAETAKANGKAKAYKSAMTIINNSGYSTLKGAIMIDGKQYVCDGFRALRFNNPIDLPMPEFDNPPNLKNVFDKSQVNSQPLPLPSIGELTSHIKLEKAKTGQKIVYWDCGEGYPLLDARYLLSILEAFPDCEAFYENDYTAVYFTSNDGDAILLPVRRKAA